MTDVGIMAIAAGGLAISPLSGSPLTILPGVGWSVTKAPTMQTRIQRAVSGRELRLQDYPYPLWQFSLTFEVLRDRWDSRGRGFGVVGNYDELRTLFGFYLACGGAFGTFLFDDPSDDQVTGQPLPLATSYVSASFPAAGGSGYNIGDQLSPAGGSPPLAASLIVNSVGGGGAITNLGPSLGGIYYTVPGTSGVPLTTVTGGGSGATANLTWVTSVQLQRGLGVGPFFNEPITAPNKVAALYFAGVPQITLVNTGIVAGGGGYNIGDQLSPTIAGPPLAASLFVQSVSGGAVTSLGVSNGGLYLGTPPSAAVPFTSVTGSGSGCTANLLWSNVAGWPVDPATGLVSLPQPFVGSQPALSADFSYFFRCRFVDDSNSFENFMLQLWQLKKLAFISVLP